MSKLVANQISPRSGNDLTLNGNVTIGGTLTYEDVTNIDSIGVITARSGVHVTGGSVGIGTDAPDAKLEVRDGSAQGIIIRSNSTQATDTNKALRVRNNSDTNTFHVSHKGKGYFASNVGIGTAAPQQLLDIASTAPNIRFTDTIDGHSEIDGNAASLKFNADKGNAKADSKITFFVDNSEKLRITSTGGVHFNNGELIERVKITAGKLSDNTDINLDDGMVHYFTTTETSASIPNITSSIGINTSMATGDTMSVTIVTTAATAAFAATFAIDHKQVGVTTFFSGGSSPTAGGSSGKDVTALTIVKTGDATFDVLANTSNFA